MEKEKEGWGLLELLGIEVDGTAMYAATIRINVNEEMSIKTEHFVRTNKKDGFVLNGEKTDLKRIVKCYKFNNETKKVVND